MKRTGILLGIFLVNAILSACAPKNILEEKPAKPERPQENQIIAKESWEMEWEKTLSAARKEGIVSISTARVAEIRDGLASAFTKKYGIEISWIVARPAEVTQKIITERKAGIYSIDLNIMGGNTSIANLKNGGFLQSFRDALILPAVKDEKAWYEGKLPFIDKERKYVFASTYYPQAPFSINTKLLPNYKEELASYYDLLKPKWKGKILSQDFLRPGGGLKWFSNMIEEDFGPILGLDYMRQLVKQEPQIILDTRTSSEWMLRGKYPIGLNLPIDAQLTNWAREGIQIPVASFTPKEGGYITAGGQVITFLDKAPHPNAARIFINWLLTREGQILLSKLTVKHSSRIDIPSPGEIDSEIIAREPHLKYPNSDEEKYLEKTDEFARIAEQIFGQLYK